MEKMTERQADYIQGMILRIEMKPRNGSYTKAFQAEGVNADSLNTGTIFWDAFENNETKAKFEVVCHEIAESLEDVREKYTEKFQAVTTKQEASLLIGSLKKFSVARYCAEKLISAYEN